MEEKSKTRTITFYKDYFEEFFVKQKEKVRAKIIWTFDLIEEVDKVPETYLKHILNILKALTDFTKLEFNNRAIFLEYFAFLTKEKLWF